MSVKEIHFCDLCGKQIPEAILIPYDTKYRHIDGIRMATTFDFSYAKYYEDICPECNKKLMVFLKENFPLFEMEG